MPRHSHEYEELRHESHSYLNRTDGNYFTCPANIASHKDSWKFLYTCSTTSVGGGSSHNNMPPFLTANCWKRTG